jgi:type III secretion protein S
MEIDNMMRLTTQGMLICLYVSLPIVVVSAGAGLLISFLQAITSLQDQTLSFAVKLVAAIVAIAVFGSWGAAMILRFAHELIAVAVPS